MMEFGSDEAKQTQEEIEEERRIKDETVKDMNRALINTIKKIQQQKEIQKKRIAESISRPAGSFQDIEMTSVTHKPREEISLETNAGDDAH